jgi:hypothetical protein
VWLRREQPRRPAIVRELGHLGLPLLAELAARRIGKGDEKRLQLVATADEEPFAA